MYDVDDWDWFGQTGKEYSVLAVSKREVVHVFFLKDPANAGLRCISRGKSYNNVVQ
jgi:hypothetical protein